MATLQEKKGETVFLRENQRVDELIKKLQKFPILSTVEFNYLLDGTEVLVVYPPEVPSVLPRRRDGMVW